MNTIRRAFLAYQKKDIFASACKKEARAVTSVFSPPEKGRFRPISVTIFPVALSNSAIILISRKETGDQNRASWRAGTSIGGYRCSTALGSILEETRPGGRNVPVSFRRIFAYSFPSECSAPRPQGLLLPPISVLICAIKSLVV